MDEQAGKSKALLWWGIAGVTLAVVAGVAVAMRLASMWSPPEPPGPEESAKSACRDAVLDRLKSPSSAEFSNEEAAAKGRRFEVTGSVDADNSFGASIRNDYVCLVSNSNGPWEVGRLTFD